MMSQHAVHINSPSPRHTYIHTYLLHFEESRSREVAVTACLVLDSYSLKLKCREVIFS